MTVTEVSECENYIVLWDIHLSKVVKIDSSKRYIRLCGRAKDDKLKKRKDTTIIGIITLST